MVITLTISTIFSSALSIFFYYKYKHERMTTQEAVSALTQANTDLAKITASVNAGTLPAEVATGITTLATEISALAAKVPTV